MKWPSAQNSSIMNNQRRIGRITDIFNVGHILCLTIHMILRPHPTTNKGWGGYYGYDRREQALRDELYTTNYYSNFNTEIFVKDFQLASLFSISASSQW